MKLQQLKQEEKMKKVASASASVLSNPNSVLQGKSGSGSAAVALNQSTIHSNHINRSAIPAAPKLSPEEEEAYMKLTGSVPGLPVPSDAASCSSLYTTTSNATGTGAIQGGLRISRSLLLKDNKPKSAFGAVFGSIDIDSAEGMQEAQKKVFYMFCCYYRSCQSVVF
jgi:hypothetical protein